VRVLVYVHAPDDEIHLTSGVGINGPISTMCGLPLGIGWTWGDETVSHQMATCHDCRVQAHRAPEGQRPPLTLIPCPDEEDN